MKAYFLTNSPEIIAQGIMKKAMDEIAGVLEQVIQNNVSFFDTKNSSIEYRSYNGGYEIRLDLRTDWDALEKHPEHCARINKLNTFFIHPGTWFSERYKENGACIAYGLPMDEADTFRLQTQKIYGTTAAIQEVVDYFKDTAIRQLRTLLSVI